MTQELSESDSDVLFVKGRCRHILQILNELTTPLSAIRLARLVGERELEDPAADEVTRIYLTLYHTHLPRLEDLEIVVYDENEGTVKPGGNFDAFTRALEGTDDRDSPHLEDARRESRGASRRIELFVRACTSTVAHERLVAVIDRLNQLSDDGFITNYRLRQWPPQGGVSECRTSSALSTSRQRIVAEFEAWAEEQGYTLKPAFGRRSGATLGSAEDAGERYTVPLLTLAFYEGETLTGVIPSADEHSTYTVADFLSARVPDGWIDLSTRERGVRLNSQ